jgi:hypothetical protein
MFARVLLSCLSLLAMASQAAEEPDLRTILQPGQILQIPKKTP